MMQSLFTPKSVAIVGASRSPGKIGHIVLQNFVNGKYQGAVYPVNPNTEDIAGLKVYKSLSAIPHNVDLVVCCIPAVNVPSLVKEAGKKGCKGMIIISSGFSEVGNSQLTAELQKAIRENPKMSVVGPNCLGVLDTRSGVDTLFLPNYRMERPKAGGISFISQSGALGSAILDWASFKEYGISKFVSYGNAMQVDEADLLQYLSDDSDTSVIAVYVEGFKDGKKFFETAKKVTMKKPVIIIKGGITEAGAKATVSHTGSLAGNFEVVKAMAKQANLTLAYSMEEVFDYARIFASEPEMKGKRIQIITNGGGYGVLSADACLENKLELAQMAEESKKEIIANSPSYAVIKNPMDLTGDADNKRFEVALRNTLQDGNVDAVLLIMLFQVPTLNSDIIETLKDLLGKRKKPVLVMSMGGSYALLHNKALEKEGINTFQSPINLAECLKALHEYYAKKKKGHLRSQ